MLAGRGALPAAVIQAAVAEGRRLFVLGFEGETDPALIAGHDHAWVRLGAVGKTIKLLHQASVDDVVLIGSIDRPSLADLKPDLRGVQLLAKFGLKAAKGDDQLLSTIVHELEGEGFRVLGADDVIKPMLAPEGIMTKAEPGDQARLDIELGILAAMRLGELDIGQAVVVQDGRVLAVEAIEGTDALLDRAGELKSNAAGGVLVKMKKPGQDRRTDLPTIGDRTVAGAIKVGLQGIAVHADQSLIVNRSAMIEKADRAGMFIVGVRPPD